MSISEKDFYQSVNPKLIEDMGKTIDELKADEEKRKEEDKPFNSEIVDSEYKRQAEADEEKQERYCEEREDEFWKWGTDDTIR